MNELIKINESGKGTPIVNARDLHGFLEIKEDFSEWLKRKIKKYGFVENLDYARIYFDVNGKKISLPKNRELDSCDFQKVFRIEYALTLECAKELAMVQNNEKGKQARLYFLEVERRYKEVLEVKLAIPVYTMSEVAARLNLSDYYGKIGRNGLLGILQHKKILKKNNKPLKKYVSKGYFTETPLRVKEEGLKWLNQMLCVEKHDTAEVKALREDLTVMKKGLYAIAETILYNKGGKRTEEQNRQSVTDLQVFLDAVKSQKALS